MNRIQPSNRRNIGLGVALLGLLVIVLSEPSGGAICFGSGGGFHHFILNWREVGVSYGRCTWSLAPAGFVGLSLFGVIGGAVMAWRNR